MHKMIQPWQINWKTWNSGFWQAFIASTLWRIEANINGFGYTLGAKLILALFALGWVITLGLMMHHEMNRTMFLEVERDE